MSVDATGRHLLSSRAVSFVTYGVFLREFLLILKSLPCFEKSSSNPRLLQIFYRNHKKEI